jgi:hypothetical protein
MGTHPKCVQTPVEFQLDFDMRGGKGGRLMDREQRTNHDQPLRLLNTILILLGIPQCLNLDVLGLLDLVRGSVANEDWLASPFDEDLFPQSASYLSYRNIQLKV